MGFHKKSLGQHFLRNPEIAEKIVRSLFEADCPDHVVEVGPGAGVLTEFLVKRKDIRLTLIEFDKRLIEPLQKKFPKADVIQADVLKFDWNLLPGKTFAVIGNFPYNISSQIVFKILEHADRIPLAVGMFQKEMAQRIVSPHGSKQYGVISVFTQLKYDTKYLFDVDRSQFHPPPAVQSGVIKLSQKEVDLRAESFQLLRTIIKQSFNQRRKTMRNSLKNLIPADMMDAEIFSKRPEQLSLEDFINLSNTLNEANQNTHR